MEEQTEVNPPRPNSKKMEVQRNMDDNSKQCESKSANKKIAKQDRKGRNRSKPQFSSADQSDTQDETPNIVTKEDDKRVKCTMCEKTWKLNPRTIVSVLRKRVKNHICNKHFEADMSVLLQNNFKQNVCQSCDSTIASEVDQKNHLQESHAVFDDIITPMLDEIFGQKKDRKKRKIKTNKISSKAKKIKLKSKQTTDVAKLLAETPTKNLTNDAKNMEESIDFERLQSCIEYSDSDEDDSNDTEAMFNVIQNNIDFSDSDDDDE